MKKNVINIFRFTCIFVLLLTLENIVVYYKKNKQFFFCQNCMNDKNISSQCFKCKPDLLFKSLKYISREETMNELIYNKKSITRVGDGEFNIMFGLNTAFQQYNKTLKDKLLKVLKSNIPNLLVGLMKLNGYSKRANNVVKYIEKYKFQIAKIINKNKIYYYHGITRFYTQLSNRTEIRNHIAQFKKIWDKRNILIIEGEKTRLGIGNDLFNNAKNIQRIICPAENAFNIYDKLLHFLKNLKLDKDTLILISLGPTATPLIYDIVGFGNQAIDFGHFDIQYELYLRNATRVIKLPNKYVNEAPGGRINITPVNDEKYFQQIICKIY